MSFARTGIHLGLAAALLVGCGQTSNDEGDSASGGTGGSVPDGTGATSAETGAAGPEGGASTGGARAETGGGLTGGSDPGGGSGGSEPGGSGGSGGAVTGGSGGSSGAPVTGGATTGGSEPGGAGTGGILAGGAGSDGPLVGLAFDLQFPEDTMCAGHCDPATLLVTGATDDRLDAVWGNMARAHGIVLTPLGNAWTFSDPFLIGSERTWEYAMCTDESNLGPGTLEFADTNGDGALELTFTAELNSRFCSDDYSMTDTREVVLTGLPDDRVPATDFGVTLLSGLTINLDKPLVGTAACALVPDTGDPVPLTPRMMAGYVVGFDTTVTLPLGVDYTTEFVGDDFAGVGSPLDIVISTRDDFGILADGGFESGSTDGVSGGEIVDAYGVEPINGSYMLYAAPGQAVALHLQRTADEQDLVLDARLVDGCGGSSGSLPIRVAVVGNDGLESTSVSMRESTTVTLDTGTIVVGELQHVVIPLPGAGTDVLVEFEGDSYTGAGCRRTGVLMDDVHLE